MLFRCCLIHATIIILRYNLCLVYLYPCLGLGPFMSYICDLFLIFSLVFIVINHNDIKTDALAFCIFFRISAITFG